MHEFKVTQYIGNDPTLSLCDQPVISYNNNIIMIQFYTYKIMYLEPFYFVPV